MFSFLLPWTQTRGAFFFFPANGRTEGRKAATPTFHRDEEKVNHHLINVGDWDVRPARLIGRPGSQCANQPVSASSAAAPSICVSLRVLVSIGLLFILSHSLNHSLHQ